MLAQLPPPDPVELEMRRVGEDRGFPIVGPLVGALLDVLVRSNGAKRIFEMGSGFGYSTWWFARAAGPDGHVVHTDGDPAKSAEAKDWLSQAGLAERCHFITGDAMEALRDDGGTYDIVFIDIDKGDYPAAWALARDCVRPGGLIITDNTLWSGQVADPEAVDEWTEAVRAYVRSAMADPDFTTTILPVRDGVAVSVRH